MALHLIRHAEAALDGPADPALTPLGEGQADRLGERMSGLALARIVHGPALRARQTAQRLTVTSPAVEVVESELARDRTPWPENGDPAYGPRARTWLASTPLHERDSGGRGLLGAFTSWVAASEDGSIAVVTHAFVIAWIAAHVVGGPADAWLRMPVDNASVTTVEHGRHGELLLRRFNSVSDSATAREWQPWSRHGALTHGEETVNAVKRSPARARCRPQG